VLYCTVDTLIYHGFDFSTKFVTQIFSVSLQFKLSGYGFFRFRVQEMTPPSQDMKGSCKFIE